MIKCIGCRELRREVMTLVSGNQEIYYNCPHYFPYMASIGGLLRPGQGITVAVNDCPEQLGLHCILCRNIDVQEYGHQVAYVCKEHDRAWGKWLDDHPERRAYLSPKRRRAGIPSSPRKANWIEVFREFVEEARRG